MKVKEAMALLNVHEPLRAGEIRRCYRRAALKHHPDKGGSASRFREICEAHDVLQAELGTPQPAEKDYSKLMSDFMQAALGGSARCESLLAALASGCNTVLSSLSSLRDMDPQTCLSALGFLEKHADLLHMDLSAIRAARDGLRTKPRVAHDSPTP